MACFLLVPGTNTGSSDPSGLPDAGIKADQLLSLRPGRAQTKQYYLLLFQLVRMNDSFFIVSVRRIMVPAA